MFSPEPSHSESVIEKEVTPEGDVFQKILAEAETIVVDPTIHRNEQGDLLAEDGQSVSHLQNELYWKIVRTLSFKQWFGDSVVRDENGEPKVVYRSSLAKSFDISEGVKFRSNAQLWQDDHFGTFFTSNREKSIDWFKQKSETRTDASYYDDEKTFLQVREKFLKYNEQQVKTFAAFIKLENPYFEKGWTELSKQDPRLISIGDFINRMFEGGETFLEELRSNHDGLYLPHSTDYGDEYAVIKSENIFILPSDINEGVQEKERAELNENYYSPVLRPRKNFFFGVLQRIIRFKNGPTNKD